MKPEHRFNASGTVPSVMHSDQSMQTEVTQVRVKLFKMPDNGELPLSAQHNYFRTEAFFT